jgi:Bacteriophage Sf6, terminase small subunit-like
MDSENSSNPDRLRARVLRTSSPFLGGWLALADAARAMERWAGPGHGAVTGRPSIYTAELAAEICKRLAVGESLNAICKDDRLPAESTVRHWGVENH